MIPDYIKSLNDYLDLVEKTRDELQEEWELNHADEIVNSEREEMINE